MTATSHLISLFSAALVTQATVVIYEHRTPGARGVLEAWAAAMNIATSSMALAGGRSTATRCELPGGGEIQVLVRGVGGVGVGVEVRL